MLRMSWLHWWRRAAKASDAPNPGVAYRVAWTKDARTWDAGRRAAIAEALGHVIRSDGFLANAYDRRYRVPGLDDLRHSGASLVALGDVLEALEHDSL